MLNIWFRTNHLLTCWCLSFFFFWRLRVRSGFLHKTKQAINLHLYGVKITSYTNFPVAGWQCSDVLTRVRMDRTIGFCRNLALNVKKASHKKITRWSWPTEVQNKNKAITQSGAIRVAKCEQIQKMSQWKQLRKTKTSKMNKRKQSKQWYPFNHEQLDHIAI